MGCEILEGVEPGAEAANVLNVTIEGPHGLAEDEVAAGSTALITFQFSHGCDGSPTTEVRIQIPAAIAQVTPTVNANWDVAKTMETLDTPIEGSHDEQITERVAEVVYTAKAPVEDGYRDTFVLSVPVPEDAAGTTLYFPTIQTCEAGETAWIEIPADGQDGEELEAPAPSIAVVEADAEDDGNGDSAEGEGTVPEGSTAIVETTVPETTVPETTSAA